MFELKVTDLTDNTDMSFGVDGTDSDIEWLVEELNSRPQLVACVVD